VFILVAWMLVDRRREAQYVRADADLEKDIEKMEKNIMQALRKRTMSKANTWNSTTTPPRR
jgi:hypothetical protein